MHKGKSPLHQNQDFLRDQLCDSFIWRDECLLEMSFYRYVPSLLCKRVTLCSGNMFPARSASGTTQLGEATAIASSIACLFSPKGTPGFHKRGGSPETKASMTSNSSLLSAAWIALWWWVIEVGLPAPRFRRDSGHGRPKRSECAARFARRSEFLA